MLKATCVILGLALLGLGVLGLTGLMPMTANNLVYVNIGVIVLGALGLVVGIYARQNSVNNRQIIKENALQRNENIDLQRKENALQKKENAQQRAENDRQRKDNEDRQKKEKINLGGQ